MLHYSLRLMTVMALCLPAWLLLRRPWRFRRNREIVLALFVVYMLALLSLALEGNYAMPHEMLESALHRLRTGEGINLKPFYSVYTIWNYTGTDTKLVNVAGNVLLFVPWGFCLPLLWKRFQSPLGVGFMSLLLTAGIEFVQLFIQRSVDVDDLILNFAGGVLGGILYLILWLFWRKIRQLAE